jgi:hypothetical protein
VIVIGLKLLADWGANSDWSFRQSSWLSNRLGSWSETFVNFEQQRRETVSQYENWLSSNWPLTRGVKFDHHDSHETHSESKADSTSPAPENTPPSDKENRAEPKASRIPHVPHLLDFHDLRRPECLFFWIAMAVCFAIGFVPRQKEKLDT